MKGRDSKWAFFLAERIQYCGADDELCLTVYSVISPTFRPVAFLPSTSLPTLANYEMATLILSRKQYLYDINLF
jgi:hypothetical protein